LNYNPYLCRSLRIKKSNYVLYVHIAYDSFEQGRTIIYIIHMVSELFLTNVSQMAFASTPTVHSLQNSFPHKLKHDNYCLWKTQVVPQLKGVDVYGFVDGSKPAPPQQISTTSIIGVVTVVDNPYYSYWNSQDNLILGALISSIEESLITHVVNCKISQDVWTTLDRMFTS
jgi:hypothetical protein